jgi:signal transduction histidine kinase
MMVDITGRKRMEEELKRARHEAEQSSLAKSEFLSRMSHELRTPLNSILGFSQLLDFAELNTKHRTWVRHILSSGKHLLNLIDEVLDIARIESGKISLSSEPVQLNSLIIEARDSIIPLAEERMLTLSWENLVDEKLVLMTDRKRIIQVLIILLSNAVKYNKPGGSVLIKSEPVFKADRMVSVRIAVLDSGSGIPAIDLPKIFNPFERIGAEKTTTEGVGLGLAIVKSILDAMGGTVGVDSTLGKGSTFWIELPVN